MDDCEPLMMGRSAVCHVCDNFDVNVRGRELEQVRTGPIDQLFAYGGQGARLVPPHTR